MRKHSGATGASLLRQAAGRLLLAGILTVGLGTFSVTDPIGTPSKAAAAAPRTPFFGATVQDLDGFVSSTAAQDALKSLGVPVLVVSAVPNASDQQILTVLSAVQRAGATPYLRMQFPYDQPTRQVAQRWTDLAWQRFGSAKVYVEFMDRGMGADGFVGDWNREVPSLKGMTPASFTFVASSAYNPDWAAIASTASPRPDALAWREPLCTRDVSDDVCARRIPTMAWHVERTNAAVKAKIGSTIPVFINEWNVGAPADERFLATAPVRKLTQDALTQLVSLKSLGLIGAAVGPAVAANSDDDHFGRGLVRRDGSLTFQGTAYRDKV